MRRKSGEKKKNLRECSSFGFLNITLKLFFSFSSSSFPQYLSLILTLFFFFFVIYIYMCIYMSVSFPLSLLASHLYSKSFGTACLELDVNPISAQDFEVALDMYIYTSIYLQLGSSYVSRCPKDTK